MKNAMKMLLTFANVLALFAIGPCVLSDQPDDFDVLDVMYEELQRSFEVLQEQDEPPYYISYEVTQDVTLNVSGSYGEIGFISDSSFRVLDIDLRVGGYELDNTHFGGAGGGASSISIETPRAIRNTLWYATNSSYRSAISRLSNVVSAMQSRVEEVDKSGDFARAPQEVHRAEFVELEGDQALFESKVQRYGRPFKRAGHIISNRIAIGGDVETRWFVNTDGTKVQVSEPYYRIVISASAKAEDGMILPRYITYASSTLAGLPKDETILKDIDDLIENLKQMRAAPLVDPYTGPAILSGRAAGVFFHEILGHRLEGHRQKAEHEGQTFKAKLGEYVLPKNFSVSFDPNLRTFGSTDLIGSYSYDNQGVRAEQVDVVENGVLKGFLMSRLPMKGFLTSNGHGRKNYGLPVVARQSNMFVTVEDPYTPEGLEEMLLERVREQGKEFGLYFEDIQGGFTITNRTLPNAFTVTPIVVYRLYLDGHKELVRGVNLIGTPLTTFSRVEAGADDYGVFNGMCGAESGQIPVSAVAPSILVSQIEVQKATSSRGRPPILSNPVENPEETSFRLPSIDR